MFASIVRFARIASLKRLTISQGGHVRGLLQRDRVLCDAHRGDNHNFQLQVFSDTCFDLFICGSFKAPAFYSSFQAPAFFKALLPLGEDPDTLGYICAIPLLSRYHISSTKASHLSLGQI